MAQPQDMPDEVHRPRRRRVLTPGDTTRTVPPGLEGSDE